MISISEVVVHRLLMPMQMRFQTSYGVQTARDVILVEVRTPEGFVGWGESVAMKSPLYTEETTDTVEAMLKHELVSLLLRTPWQHPSEFLAKARPLHGNPMAKFAAEGALWDIWAQQQGISLASAFGGVKSHVDVGVSIGIKPMDELLTEVDNYLQQGYRRIKIKVQPGWDSEPIAAIRDAFSDVPLMVDANGSYEGADDAALRKLDGYGLMMIEQPFAASSMERSARLQSQMTTDLCLDESIVTLEDATRAIRISACRVINVKLGRVGGVQATLDLVKLARDAGIQLWCGGMFETGIGRAFNIAISSLAEFTLPGDSAASSRYWKPDIIIPEVVVEDGKIKVPTASGLGFAVDTDQVARYQMVQWHYR